MAGIQHAALTEGQAGAITRAGASKEVLEQAQSVLYRALGRPQPLRERKWAERVASALADARAAIRSHRDEVVGEGGLYDVLRFEAPWALQRVGALDAELLQIEDEAGRLGADVERVRLGDLTRVGNIRRCAERILSHLRDVLAREADLIWEQFNQPSAVD